MKVKKIKKSESSTLSKAVSNIRKIIKKKDKNVKKEIVKKNVTKKELVNKSKEEKNKEKEFKSTKGIVYIGHIPYGFFEEEMQDYFEQFGKVTRVRVARSKKTGKSRGYGYIEFENPDVAKIVAETMNNYLMCGRLLKATYIPPEKQHWGFFSGKSWNSVIYPKVTNRMKELKKMDVPISEKQHKNTVKRSLKKLSLLEEKLNSIGIDLKLKPVAT